MVFAAAALLEWLPAVVVVSVPAVVRSLLSPSERSKQNPMLKEISRGRWELDVGFLGGGNVRLGTGFCREKALIYNDIHGTCNPTFRPVP